MEPKFRLKHVKGLMKKKKLATATDLWRALTRAKFDISLTAICRILDGRSNPSSPTLMALSVVLDERAENFFE